MKPFNHHYFLGYVNQVTPQFIKIHFPSSSLLEKFNHQGTFYSGGNVGNFIVVEGEEFGFLARIIEVELPDGERKLISEKAIKSDETAFHPSGKAELLLSFSVFEPKKIEKTVSKYPSIGAKVYSCSDEQIAEYIKEFGKKKDSNETDIYADLGKLTSNDAHCKVSLKSIFGRHCAIVGTTGGGKSWTMSKLIDNIRTNTISKSIIIDATGEYKKSFGENNSYVFGENVHFPFKYLTNSDFCFLFQENSPNTVAALCEAIHSLKLMHLNKMPASMTDGVKNGKSQPDFAKAVRENIHDFKDSYFDINKLATQIANECVKLGRNNNYEEDNFKLGYTSHLISRINLLLNNDVICSSLGINEKAENQSDLIHVIEEFLKPENDKSVLRIGFEKLSYDFSIRELVVEFLCYKLLIMSRAEKFKDNPLILFIDEAHQFLNKRINAEDNSVFSLQSIDLISKECRKHGLFLCLSTQMPRDIPVGTLSQMGTFIVHRLINELDKKAIENACSSANRSALSFLPILGEGEALLVGVDFPMPLLIKIDEPNKKPNSKTPKFKPKNNITKP